VTDVLGIALGLAPLAREAIAAVHDKNTIRRLMALVERDLRGRMDWCVALWMARSVATVIGRRHVLAGRAAGRGV
jgi:hypothetical protein